MNKKLFLLPLLVLGLAACGGKNDPKKPEPKEVTVTLNAKNVLGYNPTNPEEDSRNVVYGDNADGVTVEGVKVTWVGIGCYTDSTVDEVKVWDDNGWFQMRKKSSSAITFEVEGTLKAISVSVAIRKSNYDAVKPLTYTVGAETGTVDFTKDVADVAVPFTTTDASTGTIAYDLNDGYTYTVYLDHITLTYLQ